MSQPNSSSMRDGFATFYAGAVDSPWIAYFGGDYSVNDNVAVSLYTSRLKDAWNQYYFGTTLSYPLADNVALIGGFNYYNAVDEGKQLLGSFDNNIWSGKAGVKFGANWAGKLKMILQSVAIPTVLAGVCWMDLTQRGALADLPAWAQAPDWWRWVNVGWASLTVAATLLSGIPYVTAAIRAGRK